MSYRASFKIASRTSASLLRSVANGSPATFSKLAVKATPIVLNQRLFSNTSVIKQDDKKKAVLNVLQSEISVEKEINDHQEKPEAIDTFLENSGFKVVETANRNLAEIVKETDDSVVHVYFDVSQITNIPEPNVLEQEAENSEEYEFEKELGEEFANVNIVIEKKVDSSAISVEVLFKLDDGSMYIESITPYKDAKLALSESAESETTRQLTYHGPPFSNLDEQLQTSFEEYIKGLGLDESLADFLCAYSEYKENKEYFSWLSTLKSFFS